MHGCRHAVWHLLTAAMYAFMAIFYRWEGSPLHCTQVLKKLHEQKLIILKNTDELVTEEIKKTA
jgi:hypothetical protein